MFGRARQKPDKRVIRPTVNEEEDDDDDDDDSEKAKEAAAETEYGNFQGNVANIMMMGTLLFGFCATGTFLSVQFTGEEYWWWSSAQLVPFVENGMYSAISSLTATMIVFVFSTRASRHHMQYGAVAAMRIVPRSIIFFILAEILIYVSLWQFLRSMQEYIDMEYGGPSICPIDGLNHSFCSQTGRDLFQTAQTMCTSVRSNQVIAARTHPLTCATFETYSALITGDDWYEGGTYFVWDKPINGFARAGNETGVFQQHRETENMLDAWLAVVTEVADHFCNKSAAEATFEDFCTGPGASGAACAPARMSKFAADDCSGKKQDDILKCSKVCTWIYDPEVADATGFTGDKGFVPIKEVILHNVIHKCDEMLTAVLVVAVFRSLAGVFQMIKSCMTLCSDAKGPGNMAFVFDVFGLFDVCEGMMHKTNALSGDSALLSEQDLGD